MTVTMVAKDTAAMLGLGNAAGHAHVHLCSTQATRFQFEIPGRWLIHVDRCRPVDARMLDKSWKDKPEDLPGAPEDECVGKVMHP